MPDLLYILGTGSRWDDNEIRYSLRSAEQYFPHRSVVVVGEYPHWMKGAKHIRCSDHYGEQKLRNSIYKLATVVRDNDLSDSFVLMNDDFFFLRPTTKLTPGCRGRLETTMANHPTARGYYFLAMRKAYERLRQHGVQEPKDFGLHEPIMLNKFLVKDCMDRFGGAGSGYLFRTMYGNLFHPGAPTRKDRKLKSFGEDQVKAMRNASFFSTDPTVVLQASFQQWMAQRYPNPSRYER